jgi:ribosomal protein S18 acetylase RimI-like enzyme
MVAARPYAADADMALLQALVLECWGRDGPLVSTSLGDPPWWMYQHLDKLTEVDVRLWLEHDRCVAWGWLWRAEETLFFLVHPDRRHLLGEVLDWAGATDVGVLEHDHHSIELLEQHGYALCEELGWMNHMLRRLDDLPVAPVPAGYALRTVRGEEDLLARTEVHRAAFAPSRVVPESYRRVMRAWPYRPDLDQVAVAPDGSFAAFCLCWLDEQNGVGELEPVGTHPDHLRRGLATAVCRFALANLRAAGATTALVYAKHGYRALGLYEGLGFRAISRHLQYRREQGARSDRLHDG